MARPTKSRILFVQMIGRGLRTAEGKDKLLVLDHAGNHLELGMVTDIGQDYLDDGSERSSVSASTTPASLFPQEVCDECKAVPAEVAKSCPCCGAQIRAKTDVKSVEGELVELGARASGQRHLQEADKQIFFRELLALKKPHYKEGWAAAQFREPLRSMAAPELRPTCAGSPLIGYAQLAEIPANRVAKRRAA